MLDTIIFFINNYSTNVLLSPTTRNWFLPRNIYVIEFFFFKYEYVYCFYTEKNIWYATFENICGSIKV